MLSKKSPWRSCRIEMRNNRILRFGLLSQCCASRADLESILPEEGSKIVFRQHRSKAERLEASISSRCASHSGHNRCEARIVAALASPPDQRARALGAGGHGR